MVETYGNYAWDSSILRLRRKEPTESEKDNRRYKGYRTMDRAEWK